MDSPRVTPPKLPPKVAPPAPNVPTYTPAVLAMVDSDTNATVATVYLNGGGQPITGFAIPSNLSVTFAQAPYPFVAPGPGIAYYENQTHLVGGSNVLVDVQNRQLISIQTGNSTTAPVDYSQLQFIRHNGGFAPLGWQQPPQIDNSQVDAYINLTLKEPDYVISGGHWSSTGNGMGAMKMGLGKIGL